MIPLVKLVRACRSATEAHERLRFAEEIVLRVGPALERFIARRAPENSVADALQETLIAISTQVGKFKGRTDAAFWAWCYRIAWNKSADRLRKIAAHPTVSLEEGEIRRAVEASAVDSPMAHEERMDLEAALAALRRVKPPCVNYLTGRFVEGLGFPELAAIYHSTPNAMRMSVKRCLALAQKLANHRS